MRTAIVYAMKYATKYAIEDCVRGLRHMSEGGPNFMITKIEKRDGRAVPFNIEKIVNAIFKALSAVGEVRSSSDENLPFPSPTPPLSVLALSLAEKVAARLETAPRRVPLAAPDPELRSSYPLPALFVCEEQREYPPHVE
jgi:hypothetical protein